ncbi:hypothetical protein OFC17_35575, partial [Escherichia coli]|nr:hypothetical protein [Escherichia coli]
LRGDLLDRWQQQLPPESPNYFLINIATEQVEPLKAFLAEHQIVPESFYPVVRARLTAINQPKLGLAMLFGVGFGLLIER